MTFRHSLKLMVCDLYILFYTFYSLNYLTLHSDPVVPRDFQADVLFIMDSSAEVSRGDYKKEKDFVESLASYLRLSPGGTRAAVLTYGFTARLVANYDSYDTLPPFKNAVDRASYISGKILVLHTLNISFSRAW